MDPVSPFSDESEVFQWSGDTQSLPFVEWSGPTVEWSSDAQNLHIDGYTLRIGVRISAVNDRADREHSSSASSGASIPVDAERDSSSDWPELRQPTSPAASPFLVDAERDSSNDWLELRQPTSPAASPFPVDTEEELLPSSGDEDGVLIEQIDEIECRQARIEQEWQDLEVMKRQRERKLEVNTGDHPDRNSWTDEGSPVDPSGFGRSGYEDAQRNVTHSNGGPRKRKLEAEAEDEDGHELDAVDSQAGPSSPGPIGNEDGPSYEARSVGGSKKRARKH